MNEKAYKFSVRDETPLALDGGSSGDISVEELNVTMNGTYTADEGKAYSPVIVNVPQEGLSITTAEVTFTNDSLLSDDHYAVNYIRYEVYEDETKLCATYADVLYSHSRTLTIPLFNGKAYIVMGSTDVTNTTGDIELFSNNELIITGNGTVTFRVAHSE